MPGHSDTSPSNSKWIASVAGSVLALQGNIENRLSELDSKLDDLDARVSEEATETAQQFRMLREAHTGATRKIRHGKKRRHSKKKKRSHSKRKRHSKKKKRSRRRRRSLYKFTGVLYKSHSSIILFNSLILSYIFSVFLMYFKKYCCK